VLRDYRDQEECAERLIDLALRAGGPDNITAIVADIVEVDDTDPDALRPMAAVSHRADEPTGEQRLSPRPRTAPAPELIAGDQPPSGAAGAANHRLTLALVVLLVVLLAAAGVWWISTG
jgi:protein phosphatase